MLPSNDGRMLRHVEAPASKKKKIEHNRVLNGGNKQQEKKTQMDQMTKVNIIVANEI